MKERQGGGRQELTTEQSKLKERAKPKKRSTGGKPVLSSVEQKNPDKLSPIPEGEEKEQKFEITERERYLLEIMAHVMAENYLPSLGRERDPYSKRSMERILRSGINKSTKIIPS